MSSVFSCHLRIFLIFFSSFLFLCILGYHLFISVYLLQAKKCIIQKRLRLAHCLITLLIKKYLTLPSNSCIEIQLIPLRSEWTKLRKEFGLYFGVTFPHSLIKQQVTIGTNADFLECVLSFNTECVTIIQHMLLGFFTLAIFFLLTNLLNLTILELMLSKPCMFTLI